MRDREKLIDILEHCTNNDCEGCPNHFKDGRVACYYYTEETEKSVSIPVQILYEAIAYLNDDEFRAGLERMADKKRSGDKPIDRKELIKALECCIEAKNKNCPVVCPFYKECFSAFESSAPFYPLMRAALEFLKAQPDIVRCKDCKHWDKTTREEGNDCISGPWEDAECDMFRDWDRYGDLGEDFRRTNGDWFCGDGEVRQDE